MELWVVLGMSEERLFGFKISRWSVDTKAGVVLLGGLLGDDLLEPIYR